jgi:hypothetical protein
VIREPMDENRIEGVAEQGEWSMDPEALVIKLKGQPRRNALRRVDA